MNNKDNKVAIILIVLIFILLLIFGYLFYKNYQSVKDLNKVTEETKDTAWQEYKDQMLAKSIFGKVKKIDNTTITIVDEDNKEHTYKIVEATIFEKLGETNSDGSQIFIQMNKDEIKENNSVWVVLESEGSENASYIKVTNSDSSTDPTPTPTNK